MQEEANEMWYNNRKEVEQIGHAGAYYYEDNINGDPIIIGRHLSSYWLAAKPNDPGVSEHIRSDGFWEAWITVWMSRNISPGSFCIDVGANYGYYTFFLALHGCKVIAVEANPDLIPFLKKSVELNRCHDRVQIANKAATNISSGTIKLNLRDNTLNSTIANSPVVIGSYEVEKIALDDLTNEQVDFIKIDVEGAEELVWGGMKRIMLNKNCIAMMEFTPHLHKDKGKFLFEQIIAGHNTSYIDHHGHEQTIEDYGFFGSRKELFWMLVIRAK